MSAVGRNEGGYHYHSYDVHSRRGRGVPHRQSRGYGSSSQTRRIVQTSQGRTRLELNINYDAFRNVDTYQVDREKQPDYGPFSIDDYLSHFYRTVKRGCRPKEAFFKLFLRSLTDKGFLLEAKKILDLIGKSIDKRSAVGLLIKEFGLKGEVAEAKVLYDSLSAAERNSTLISTMMSVYGNSCDLDSVEEFYSSIPQQSKTAHTDQAYEAAKRKCREKKGKGVDRVFEAKHAITSDASHRNNVNAELVEIQTTAEFIKIHARAGMIDAAGALYTDATKRFGDRVELKAAMIYSYGEAKMLRQALQIFNTIQFSEMTASVAAAMINVFGKMGNIEEAKIHFQNIGFEEDSSVVDSMVVAYCDVDKVDEARELFEKYPDQVRSEESHMALIECYGKKGSIDEAAEVFDRIRAVPKSFERYLDMF